MPIRFKYDATGVSIPANKQQQKFGEQLVLQRQKYVNDQQQAMQDRAYDQQRMFQQNAVQLQRDQNNRDFEVKRMKDAAALSEEARVNEAKRREEQQKRVMNQQWEVSDFETKSAVTNSMIQNALKNPNVPMSTKKQLQNYLQGEQSLNPLNSTPEQRKEYLDKRNMAVNGLLSQIPPEEPVHMQANKNLLFYDPRKGGYVDKFEPGVGMVTIDPVNKKQWDNVPMNPAPMTAQQYYGSNDALFKKDLNSKVNEIQSKIDAGDMKLEPGQDVRSIAWQEMQDDYNFAQQALGRNQAPYQNGQPSDQMTQPGTTPQPASPQQQPAASTPSQQPTPPATPSPAPAPAPIVQQAAAMPQNPLSDSVLADPQGAAAITQPKAVNPSAPDFGKLAASATDSLEKAAIGKLQGMYETASPQVQSAISVFVNPDSDAASAAQAYDYLKSQGVDVLKLVGPTPGTGTARVNQYQNNLNTTMR